MTICRPNPSGPVPLARPRPGTVRARVADPYSGAPNSGNVCLSAVPPTSSSPKGSPVARDPERRRLQRSMLLMVLLRPQGLLPARAPLTWVPSGHRASFTGATEATGEVVMGRIGHPSTLGSRCSSSPSASCTCWAKATPSTSPAGAAQRGARLDRSYRRPRGRGAGGRAERPPRPRAVRLPREPLSDDDLLWVTASFATLPTRSK